MASALATHGNTHQRTETDANALLQRMGVSLEVFLTMPIREKNNLLKRHQIPKTQEEALMKLRRTLKSREYAAKAREKKENEKNEMIRENEELTEEIITIERQIAEFQHKIDYFEREIKKYEYQNNWLCSQMVQPHGTMM